VNAYQRLFGSGPLGVAFSLALTLLATWIRARLPSGDLGIPLLARQLILAIAAAGTLAGVVWTIRSLPVVQRGLGLCTRGAYGWVRHPLYASFLSAAVPGIALYLDHWIYLAWIVALHVLWHLVVAPEERMMRAEFGEAWDAYARRTGRFIPRMAGAFSSTPR
jgi:protein-S-isoprenylcysteine O-methyltransferase Ste14